MITTNKNIDKALLISVIEGYVFMNTKIFTCLGIMMHLMVKHCVDKNHDLPNNFIDENVLIKPQNGMDGKEDYSHSSNGSLMHTIIC